MSSTKIDLRRCQAIHPTTGQTCSRDEGHGGPHRPSAGVRKCAAIGCMTAVPARMLMCRPHWNKVPTAIKRDVLRHYSPGQEQRMDPSDEYLEAMKAAIAAVGKK